MASTLSPSEFGCSQVSLSGALLDNFRTGSRLCCLVEMELPYSFVLPDTDENCGVLTGLHELQLQQATTSPAQSKLLIGQVGRTANSRWKKWCMAWLPRHQRCMCTLNLGGCYAPEMSGLRLRNGTQPFTDPRGLCRTNFSY